MKRTILITTLLIFILTACSTGSATTDQPPTPLPATETAAPPTNTPAPTDAEPSQDGPATTEETAQEPEPTVTEEPEPERVQIFAIVPGESSVTYEVGEVFINQGNVINVAVGVTDMLSGEIQIDFNNPPNSTMGPISVDISEFTSDRALRDEAIRENWLESGKYPIATFLATQIEGVPEVGEEGVEYPVQIIGEMTIREITNEVTFDATVKLENGELTGTAATTLLMSDFEVGPINIIGILKTEDEVKLTLNFVARPNTGQQ
jgi:polyisoprenoid-binding protein YceI